MWKIIKKELNNYNYDEIKTFTMVMNLFFGLPASIKVFSSEKKNEHLAFNLEVNCLMGYIITHIFCETEKFFSRWGYQNFWSAFACKFVIPPNFFVTENMFLYPKNNQSTVCYWQYKPHFEDWCFLSDDENIFLAGI